MHRYLNYTRNPGSLSCLKPKEYRAFADSSQGRTGCRVELSSLFPKCLCSILSVPTHVQAQHPEHAALVNISAMNGVPGNAAPGCVCQLESLLSHS